MTCISKYCKFLVHRMYTSWGYLLHYALWLHEIGVYCKDNKAVLHILVASTETFYRQQLLKVVVGAIYVIGFNWRNKCTRLGILKIDFPKLLCEAIV